MIISKISKTQSDNDFHEILCEDEDKVFKNLHVSVWSKIFSYFVMFPRHCARLERVCKTFYDIVNHHNSEKNLWGLLLQKQRHTVPKTSFEIRPMAKLFLGGYHAITFQQALDYYIKFSNEKLKLIAFGADGSGKSSFVQIFATGKAVRGHQFVKKKKRTGIFNTEHNRTHSIVQTKKIFFQKKCTLQITM